VLRRQASDLDPATLEAIAKATGGRYFQATDTQQLEAIYQELDRLEPTEGDAHRYRPIQSLYYWPAGLALLLALPIPFWGARRPADGPGDARENGSQGDSMIGTQGRGLGDD